MPLGRALHPGLRGSREVPVAQPAPEGPAPGGVCGRHLRGLLQHRRAWSTPPTHPPGALSRSTVLPTRARHPLAQYLVRPSHPLPNAPTSSPAALNAASSGVPFHLQRCGPALTAQAWRCPAGLTCPAVGTTASLSSCYPRPGRQKPKLGSGPCSVGCALTPPCRKGS